MRARHVSVIVDNMVTSPLPERDPWWAWVHSAVERFGAGLRVACSLSIEDALLVDGVAASARKLGLGREGSPTVFVLDTGRLHEESHHVRKDEPLGRALAGASAWMTGQRRAPSTTRSALALLEVDRDHGGIAKLNPLAFVDDEALWADARSRDAIVLPLHETGYPSIGCAPCTRAVAPEEDVRAGRWWCEDLAHKECGLHVRHGAVGARS